MKNFIEKFKTFIEKLKTFDKKLVQWERKYTFLARLIKVFFFTVRSFLIGSIICLFVDSVTSDTFTIGQIIGCSFVVYFFLGEPLDNLIYTDDVLDNHLQRIESLEEKTDLLETQQDCIEKWYLNDDL